MNDANRIRRLLESVSDGTAIDWGRESTEALDDRERAAIAQLRSISAIWDLSGAGSEQDEIVAAGSWMGHLRIVEKLGSGAYGDVFRAWDSRLEREIALKVLAPEEPSPRAATEARTPSYLEEARRLAGVRHPNVVSVYSVERLEGDPLGRSAIVMELIRGRTLASVVRRDGRLGALEIAAIGIELCRALSAVHLRGMVHRDVKAQNVMREEGGRIVLMDFGPGGGTPLYMAPETLRGAAPSVVSDVYSLSTLLYYLAAGDFPVRGVTKDDLVKAHESGRAVPLRDARPDLPATLVRAIERGLARDPGERHASAGELERALGSVAHHPPAEARSASGASLESANAQKSANARAGSLPPEANDTGIRPLRTKPPRAVQRAVVFLVAGLGVMIAIGAYLASRSERTSAPARTAGEIVGASDAAAGGAFTIAAAAHRGSGQRERLTQGARVAPGDSISLSITSSESLYVYVINQDERGDAYLLFPAAEYRPRNPLAPGIRHRLPGAREGRLAYWQITSAGVREHLLLVASRTRLGSFENAAEALARPSRDGAPATTSLDPAMLAELRGMGGYVEEESAAEARALSESLFEIADPLTEGEETARGTWIRKLVLENPPS